MPVINIFQDLNVLHAGQSALHALINSSVPHVLILVHLLLDVAPLIAFLMVNHV